VWHRLCLNRDEIWFNSFLLWRVTMYKKVVILFLAAVVLMASSANAKERASTGINFRLGFWNMGSQDRFLTYIEENGREYIKTGGAGGWISFVSRTSELMSFEFSLGAFGRAEGENFDYWDENIDGTAVIPVLFGVQRDLISVYNSSDLRPYISFGGGPYWITEVTDNGFNREEVLSGVDMGGYAGGGLNFFLGQNFAVNFDARYHFVDFSTENDISGLEVGLGFSIFWGKYGNN